MEAGRIVGGDEIQNHVPIVIDAKRMPITNDGQKDKPVRLEIANGTKNGSPSGTSTSVERARAAIEFMSCSLFHVIMNARMLMIGSVNNNAPALGIRPAISATATITTAEINALTIIQIMSFTLFVSNL